MEKLTAWVEIPAKDIRRAAEFYSKLFDIELSIQDFGEEKMACFPTGEGAVIESPNCNPEPSGVLVSFNCPRTLELSLDTARQNGAKILIEKTKIEAEGRDYFAVILDSEGNKIGLYGE